MHAEDEVFFYTGSHIEGTRVSAYFGPVTATVAFARRAHLGGRWHLGCWCHVVADECIERALDVLVDEVCAKALQLGANSVVAFELTGDPWSGTLAASGSAAKLEPLFGAAAA